MVQWNLDSSHVKRDGRAFNSDGIVVLQDVPAGTQFYYYMMKDSRGLFYCNGLTFLAQY